MGNLCLLKIKENNYFELEQNIINIPISGYGLVEGKIADTDIEFFESHLTFKNTYIKFIIFHDDIDYLIHIQEDDVFKLKFKYGTVIINNKFDFIKWYNSKMKNKI